MNAGADDIEDGEPTDKVCGQPGDTDSDGQKSADKSHELTAPSRSLADLRAVHSLERIGHLSGKVCASSRVRVNAIIAEA